MAVPRRCSGPTRSDPVHTLTLRDSRPADQPRRRPVTASSAGSGELLCERRQELAAIVVAQPLRQLCAGELALRLDHGALAVRPARVDRVQPRALARQAADQETAPGAGGLDPAVVLPDPRADLAADVPGGVVPD